jgi:hypothetical protein
MSHACLPYGSIDTESAHFATKRDAAWTMTASGRAADTDGRDSPRAGLLSN